MPKRVYMIRILVLALPILFASLGVEAGQAPAGEQKGLTQEEILADPYFRALLQIGLKKPQSRKFRELVDDYAYKRQKAIDKEKRRYSGDLVAIIDKAHKKISKKFLLQMDRLLDDDQFNRFHFFHVTLDEKLKVYEGLDENIRAEDVDLNWDIF